MRPRPRAAGPGEQLGGGVEPAAVAASSGQAGSSSQAATRSWPASVARGGGSSSRQATARPARRAGDDVEDELEVLDGAGERAEDVHLALGRPPLAWSR